MNDDKPNPTAKLGSPSAAPVHTIVDIPGGTRTDFSDGSPLVEGPEGDKYPISETGEINGPLPEIRRVQIEDLAQVQNDTETPVATKAKRCSDCLQAFARPGL
ncbi:hypothetical protein WL93_20420 [Burkholderia diffusa]|uniref:hypothetical protein n=1 Tax=Burkholderia diffusa TaxID=488732 RepID=UPI00075A6394|nr:hypothetical protein [Burkholderia diffusa]KWF84904.1 hypothetical protein WL93_20420 [Burkholderia diffusa]